MSIPHRPRRLRQSPALRQLVTETRLHPHQFIAPLFCVEGENRKEEIEAMPGYYRFSIDLLQQEVKELWQMGVRSVLLFAKIEDKLKDNHGKEALNPKGLMPRAMEAIKATTPEICLMSDVALDPYSRAGHDGIVEKGRILNDQTLDVLAAMAVNHARHGADLVAPSDMMDGRVAAIRKALDQNGFTQTGIMSYTAKYASCFYGPFRTALESAPVEEEGIPRDKKTYQMDPANAREALREAHLDIQEAADILMVKPALAYLDIIRSIRDMAPVPLAAYHVSGEYAMIKAAAARGWLDEDQAIIESLTAIKRAGADLIATYFVKDIIRLLP